MPVGTLSKVNWDVIDEGPYSLGVVAIRWWIFGGQKLPGMGKFVVT
jgi:hypothetical protein